MGVARVVPSRACAERTNNMKGAFILVANIFYDSSHNKSLDYVPIINLTTPAAANDAEELGYKSAHSRCTASPNIKTCKEIHIYTMEMLLKVRCESQDSTQSFSALRIP